MPLSIRRFRSFSMVFSLLITLLLLSNGPAYAEWVAIGSSESLGGYTVYVDPDTIRRNGDLACGDVVLGQYGKREWGVDHLRRNHVETSGTRECGSRGVGFCVRLRDHSMPRATILSAYLIIILLFVRSNVLAGFIGPVVSVLDGDTTEVLHNTHPERVRLSGIDCPEKGQAFGNRAKQAASAFVFGRDVLLQTHGQDKYGRTLADVLLLDSTKVNNWWYRRRARTVRAVGIGGEAWPLGRPFTYSFMTVSQSTAPASVDLSEIVPLDSGILEPAFRVVHAMFIIR